MSGGLVLVIGLLGLVAGHGASTHARDVHRADRMALQETLAGLVEQYTRLSAAEVVDALAVPPAGAPDASWSTRPGDPATVRRLEALVAGTRALDAGALLVDPVGRTLAAWAPEGELPAADDPGWAPLRAAVRRGDGTLPLSGVLTAGRAHVLAVGLPVPLADGRRGLVVGLWDVRRSGLQTYVSDLVYGETGAGYVLDAAGVVLAGPDAPGQSEIGRPLQHAQVLEAIRGDQDGLVEDVEDDHALLVSHAAAGATGWTAATVQDRAEFEGALVRSGRLVEGLVALLLVIAGAGLVVMNRKREAALQDAALVDDLTGVYNRRGWTALAEHELLRARRQGSARVLLFVDVDGLKQVNDHLGHREGDRAIAAAAGVLVSASRSSDLVGRLGGDEFVLLLGERDDPEVARRRVLAALEQHNAGSVAPFELRLSVGAEVWFPDSADTLADLVRRADEQMYASKTSRPKRGEGVLRLPDQRTPQDDALPTA